MALSTAEGDVELFVSEESVFSSIHASSEYSSAKFGADISTNHKETVPMQRLETFIDAEIKDFSERRVLLKWTHRGMIRMSLPVRENTAINLPHYSRRFRPYPSMMGVPNHMEMLAMFREFEYEVTGLYTVSRHRQTGHIIELDCVMVPLKVMQGTF